MHSHAPESLRGIDSVASGVDMSDARRILAMLDFIADGSVDESCAQFWSLTSQFMCTEPWRATADSCTELYSCFRNGSKICQHCWRLGSWMSAAWCQVSPSKPDCSATVHTSRGARSSQR